jgi:GR25 family glycosyltransferase involved in LPS biosynthesis
MKVYVINLDRDVDRWSRVAEELRSCSAIEVERVAAVYGAALPDSAVVELTRSSSGPKWKGTLGTFLSHVKAWERIAKSDNFSAVIEDDAVFNGLDRIACLEIPSDADLVFINDRMSPGSRYASPDLKIECMPIVESLKTLNITGFGVGGDGYLMSSNAARTLLSVIKKDRFFGHVDWRLLRYCTTPEVFQGEFSGTRIATIVPHHHNVAFPPAWGILRAYCLNYPVIGFGVGGRSSRGRADGC